MLNNYLCVLDISSSKIVAACAKLKRGQIREIFFESDASKGIKEGSIVDSIELISSISRILKNLKAKSDVNIKYVFTNISSSVVTTKHSHAIIPLAERGNKIITLSDIEKVNEQARILGSSIEEEIIHKIPFGYTIDSNDNIINPLGLYSHRLEVDLYLVLAKLSYLQNLSRVISQAGYELKNLYLAGIAISSVVFNKELKSGLTLLCDIGQDVTELLLFKDGLLRSIEILRLGGSALTYELSRQLKISFDLAEDLKRSYISVGDYEHIASDKEILIKKDNLYRPIKQRFACEIATAETKLICEKIKNTAKEMASFNELDNFVVTGRAILLTGFLEMLESNLGISVQLGRISHPKIIPFLNKIDVLTGQKYLSYLTALGIICQAQGEDTLGFRTIATETSHNPLFKVINRIKEVYQEYF
jgi:cell division protein FtsA